VTFVDRSLTPTRLPTLASSLGGCADMPFGNGYRRPAHSCSLESPSHVR
jgi:hypothetical protein